MLTRGTEGAMRSYRILMKGAGANGYISRFIHVCNYALRCYYSCYCHTTQKVTPSS